MERFESELQLLQSELLPNIAFLEYARIESASLPVWVSNTPDAIDDLDPKKRNGQILRSFTKMMHAECARGATVIFINGKRTGFLRKAVIHDDPCGRPEPRVRGIAWDRDPDTLDCLCALKSVLDPDAIGSPHINDQYRDIPQIKRIIDEDRPAVTIDALDDWFFEYPEALRLFLEMVDDLEDGKSTLIKIPEQLVCGHEPDSENYATLFYAIAAISVLAGGSGFYCYRIVPRNYRYPRFPTNYRYNPKITRSEIEIEVGADRRRMPQSHLAFLMGDILKNRGDLRILHNRIKALPAEIKMQPLIYRLAYIYREDREKSVLLQTLTSEYERANAASFRQEQEKLTLHYKIRTAFTDWFRRTFESR